jgi:hypothetical protein
VSVQVARAEPFSPTDAHRGGAQAARQVDGPLDAPCGGARAAGPTDGLLAIPAPFAGSSAAHPSATGEATTLSGFPVPTAMVSAGAFISGSTDESSLGLPTGSAVVYPLMVVPAPPLERPHTRLQSGVSKLKKFTNGTIRYA